MNLVRRRGHDALELRDGEHDGDPVIGNNADTETTTVVGSRCPPSIRPPARRWVGTTVAVMAIEAGMAVTFGGVPASLLKVLDSTRLLAIAPAHATGAVMWSSRKHRDRDTRIRLRVPRLQRSAESASDLDGDGISDLFEMRYRPLDLSVGF